MSRGQKADRSEPSRRAGIWIVIALMLAVLGYSYWRSTRPVTVRIERQVMVDAPPDKIFPHLNQPQKWPGWWSVEPYLSNNVELRYQGPESGVGAVQSWNTVESHPEAENVTVQNTRRISHSVTNEQVRYETTYTVPDSPGRWDFSRIGTIQLVPQADTTNIVWVESWTSRWGQSNVSHQEFARGQDMADALEKLKTLVEADGAADE